MDEIGLPLVEGVVPRNFHTPDNLRLPHVGIGNYGGEGWSEKKNKQTIQQFKQQTNKKQFRLNKVGSSSLWWGIDIFLKLHNYDFCF